MAAGAVGNLLLGAHSGGMVHHGMIPFSGRARLDAVVAPTWGA